MSGMSPACSANAIRVKFGVQIDGDYVLMPTTALAVIPGIAAEYGFMEARDPDGSAVVLDALVEAHRVLFGSAFTPLTCGEYMQMKSRHWLGKAFGKKAYYSGFTINGSYAYERNSEYKSKRGYLGLPITKARIQEGDAIEIFAFQDSMGMDYYTYFMQDGKRVANLAVHPGEHVGLSLEGLMYSYGGPMKRSDRVRHHLVSPVTGSQLVIVGVESGTMTPLRDAVTDERDGKVEIMFDNPGEYYVSAKDGKVRYNVNLTHPWLKVTVS